MSKDIYWLNKASRAFLGKDYLRPGATPEQRMKEIADCAEKERGIDGFADRFHGYLCDGHYSLSSPVWAALGNGRGSPISCFGHYVDDKMEAILEKVAETGMETKIGGGTSGYFGALRARGQSISVGGTSTGPIHFLQLFETVTNVVSQSNIRRGSFAAYLPVDHPDIEEFLDIRSEGNPIQKMSIGVCISDAWMQAMVDGDKDKRKVWLKIIKKRFETGYPYLFFTDTVNRGTPQVYKDKGMKVYASNLCVTGDTLVEIIVDDKPPIMIRISDLRYYMISHDIKVRAYDHGELKEVYSSVTGFAQTGESTELIEIEDESGHVLRCTPEHKVYTQNRGYVEAGSLKEDDILKIVS